MNTGRRTTRASRAANGSGGTARRRTRRALLLSLMLAVGLVSLAASGTLFSGSARRAETAASQDAPGADQQISASAAAQIAALADEKRSRTPTQKKIDSQLLYASKMQRGEPIAAGVQSLAVNVAAAGDGRAIVDISANLTDEFLQSLARNGASVISSSKRHGSVRAEVGLDRIEAIAASPDVRFIQSKQEAMTSREARAERAPAGLGDVPLVATKRVLRPDFAQRAARVREKLSAALAAYRGDDSPVEGEAGANAVGARRSQGDVTHRADIARRRYNVDGTGIRIGVLSDGVVNLTFAQASGDLPPDVTVLPGQAGSGDEGTAMLEIVHDLAPGAKLYFATAFSGITNFADNIRTLRNDYDCDIIVDDIFYFAESVFQDGQAPAIVSNTNGGSVTQAVNDVTADGAEYFSSAGNEGNLNDGTSGVHESDFRNGGTIALIGGAGAGPVHDFDPGAGVSQFNRITLGSGNPVTLTWADPLGGSANDYDLYVLNAAGTALVAASTGAQDGTQDPFEAVGGGANVTNNRVVVAKFSGADRYLHTNTFRGRYQFATDGQTHGHSSAALAYSVAATPVVGPFPQPFNSSNVVETFESDGPRRLFFQPNGTPYTPGNFSSTGGTVRQKPDITAADGGVVSGAGGFPNPFFGTSAAAPHAAAIAALVKDAAPAISQAQLRNVLNASAIDIEAPGVDRDSGVGIIMADTAVNLSGAPAAIIEVTSVTATEASGNGNTFVEPGERGNLFIQLRNNLNNTITGVTGTLVSNTPGVTIVPPNTRAWPSIPAGLATTNDIPFQFIVGSGVPNPSTLSFTLTVNFTGGPSPQVVNVTYDMRRTAVISTTLDAAAPPSGEGFTSTTGLQTGRLVRTAFGSESSCGIQKANPGVNAADANVPHRYDAYSFINPTDLPICVTVTLTTSVAQAGLLQSAVYAPTFNPLDPDVNYVGDIAGNGSPTRIYSVIIPANTTFVVVVNEVTGGSGSVPYTLTVDGLPTSTAPPALTSLQFSPTAANVTEDCTSVTLTVTRTGETAFAASVDYATNDGTANSRSDYTRALGRVDFASGETSKTITLLISEDSRTEAAETFTVTLSNAQGVEAFVGAANTATVTINDDGDTNSPVNPIDDSTVFVCQQYHDFLAREPDAGGLAFWVNNIESCGADTACREARRIDTSAAFFLSIEFQESGGLVYRLYQAAYGRRIGGTVPLTLDEFLFGQQRIIRGVIVGQGNWQAQLQANKEAYALEFVQSTAFLAQYPRTLTEAAFVDALNANTGGSLSTAERNALIAELSAANNSDAGRASVLLKVADDADFKAAEFNRQFVLAEYFGYLRRNPNDPPDANFDGFNFWLTKLNQFNGDFRAAEMVKAFLNSIEYRQRFGQ